MKRYKVIGAVRFQEHAVGEEFSATLDPDLESRAIARGSLEILGEEATPGDDVLDQVAVYPETYDGPPEPEETTSDRTPVTETDEA